ncbi:exodeoxyribonuclease VII large subunit [Sphingomonas nostoxanthinifaciens]|uniref:exodeoxyribonuclease VII large subunit n=1 Tax=Sphingomonas nostoxanthinifaciens TaxID=2872652 RepID=UPI001CC1DF31|nr:exodeoxyribonuclease VII large subunit [Sphingomonas nostoxanthinifaciens]UAK25197.1 exodeoxyribonuclease VII large subunit [Sphingomonas nostoxanthinifaciens]
MASTYLPEDGRLLAEDVAGDNSPALSVSELSGALKRSVEDAFSHVRVRGEISGFKRVGSGHSYLTLKDDRACLDAVIWKGTPVAFRPEDGAEVIATGRLTTYPGRSRYQIVIERLELAGQGALMALLDQRRRALASEGLFAEERKRPLPFLPARIGVVTSPTGAVIRDILHRLEDRCPTHVIVWPVAVQGEGAAAQVAAAVTGFAALPTPPDLIIVARGGGSIEDLWAFNEDVVVRAVAGSPIPVISAVGHETDVTLCDFAADRRAPTPTAAAEMAVPVRAELLMQVRTLGARTARCVNRYREHAAERLAAVARHLPSPDRLLGPQRQRLDDLSDRLPRALSRSLAVARGELAQAAGAMRPALLQAKVTRGRERLAAVRLRPALVTVRIDDARDRLGRLWRLAEQLHPDRPLARGYARVETRAGRTVASATAARTAGAVTLVFADGSVAARVEATGRPAYDKTKPEQPSLL